MRPIIIGFGLLILCLLILFRIAEVNFIQGDVKLEIIVAIAAVIFFFAGIYFNDQSARKRAAQQPVAPPNPGSVINYEEIKKAGLTQREHELKVGFNPLK